jgi:hypothetical protein
LLCGGEADRELRNHDSVLLPLSIWSDCGRFYDGLIVKCTGLCRVPAFWRGWSEGCFEKVADGLERHLKLTLFRSSADIT